MSPVRLTQIGGRTFDFLQEEYLDFCKKGFWMLLSHDAVRPLPHLRLSLLGVVPQREKRPYVVLDYSYYSINAETAKMSAAESIQFRKANKSLWDQLTWAHPKWGRCPKYKIDISDGFYRMP
jgi:hypothetical protein